MSRVVPAVRRARPCRPKRLRRGHVALSAALIAAAAAGHGARAAAEPPARVAGDAVPIRVQTSAAPAQVAGERSPGVVALGGRIGGGLVFPQGLPMGGAGRLGVDVIISPFGPGSGPFYAVTEQLELWRAPGATGFAVAGDVFFGYRALPLVAGLGFGLNAFTLDWQGEELGFGIYSPRAGARIGLQLGRFYALAEAGVQHRWRWTLDDPTIAQAGLALGYIIVPELGAGPP